MSKMNEAVQIMTRLNEAGLANFGNKRAKPFKKEDVSNSVIHDLQRIGAKLIPIIKELDRLEQDGDSQLVGFIKGISNKLNDIEYSIQKYKRI